MNTLNLSGPSYEARIQVQGRRYNTIRLSELLRTTRARMKQSRSNPLRIGSSCFMIRESTRIGGESEMSPYPDVMNQCFIWSNWKKSGNYCFVHKRKQLSIQSKFSVYWFAYKRNTFTAVPFSFVLIVLVFLYRTSLAQIAGLLVLFYFMLLF